MIVDTNDALPKFSDETRKWFSERFGRPTPVQTDGWELIARGEHALLSAPTGSGKTLAAFLWCVDRLLHEPPDLSGYAVVYVSPLKALAHDIRRNLTEPLEGIRQAAEQLGRPTLSPRVDLRTGDTPANERQRHLRKPGRILVTTPESLFLLLGSQAAKHFSGVHTVIVDEIHALAPTKRGVHLAVSLERLSHLARTDPQRIGLSATIRPLDEVARYLGGSRPVSVVDASHIPNLELTISSPAMGAPRDADEPSVSQTTASRVATPPQGTWQRILPQILQCIRAHQSTIVFVNSRRLAERLCQQLNELAGTELARAHHGSMSHKRREDAESRLKAGTLPAIIATSSLELGIDMGAVDLVIQVESPGSVTRGLQRIGRAGHHVGVPSKGIIFPKFRGDLLESVVVAERMRKGAVEEIAVPRNTLDVLAQQIVAIVSHKPWALTDIGTLVRQAYSFSDLSEAALTATVEMLAGAYPSADFSDLRPRLNWDRSRNELVARKGAKLLAAVNAGTIPDRGNYAVVLADSRKRIGELDEEMIYETRPGETFLLGASTWRIEEITRDEVVVRPAPGEPGKMPFWHGDRPGRPLELGRLMGELVRHIVAMPAQDAEVMLAESYRLDRRAAQELVDYVSEQLRTTGTVPTDRTIVVERFQDELGDWRVCLLSGFGSRVHATWALAIERRLAERRGLRVETLWTDNGIVLRVANSDEVPATEELFPDAAELEELVVAHLADSTLFASHFRENAARALLLPRKRLRGRQPLWIQRLRAQKLLAVAERFPEFPILLETYRECLQTVFDVASATDLLRQIQDRRIRLETVETGAPSPFAQELAFAYVANYLYEGDAPLAERSAQALTLNRTLLGQLLGQGELSSLLDSQVIEDVERELQGESKVTQARNEDDLADLLRRVGDLSLSEMAVRSAEDPRPWLDSLLAQHRVVAINVRGEPRFVTFEQAAMFQDASERSTTDLLATTPATLTALAGRWGRWHGPFTTSELATRYGLELSAVESVLEQLSAADELISGSFRPHGAPREWCHREVLRLIRRRTLTKLRHAIAPVDSRAFVEFVPRWQGIDARKVGTPGLRSALAQLEGAALPFSELETRILPARVANYHPSMLDELAALGEIVWIGRGTLGSNDGRVALYRRERAARLIVPNQAHEPGLDGVHEEILNHIVAHGASFAFDLLHACKLVDPQLLMSAIWDLVWSGHLTNDSFEPLRQLRSARSGRPGRAQKIFPGGRWSVVTSLSPSLDDSDETAQLVTQALALVDRYGLITRDVVATDGLLTTGAPIMRVLGQLEEAGRVRRGYFVEGLSGLQFVHATAVDQLRAGSQLDGSIFVLAATDPANPFGTFLPWPEVAQSESVRPQRRAGCSVVLARGTLALFLSSRDSKLTTFAGVPEDALEQAITCGLSLLAKQRRRLSLRIAEVDGRPAEASAFSPLLRRAGFRTDDLGLVLDISRLQNNREDPVPSRHLREA